MKPGIKNICAKRDITVLLSGNTTADIWLKYISLNLEAILNGVFTHILALTARPWKVVAKFKSRFCQLSQPGSTNSSVLSF